MAYHLEIASSNLGHVIIKEGRGGILSFSELQHHCIVMGVCKLTHVEVSGRRFLPSVLRSPGHCMSAASEKALNDSCCVIEDSCLVAGLELAMPKLGRKLEGDKQYSRSGNLLATYVVTESQTHATESHAKPQRVTGPRDLCGLQ